MTFPHLFSDGSTVHSSFFLILQSEEANFPKSMLISSNLSGST